MSRNVSTYSSIIKPFYFEITLNLQKNCKYIEQSSHIPFTQIPIMFIIFKTIVQWSNQEINISMLLLAELKTYSNFSFPLISLFSSTIQLRSHITYSCCVLRLLQAMTVPKSFHIFWYLIIFILMVSYFVTSNVFSWLEWGYAFWQENYRSDVSFSLHYIKGKMIFICIITSSVNLNHKANMVFVSFFQCKFTTFLW